MNSIMQTQAVTLRNLCLNTNLHFEADNNDLRAHIYLEAMQMPVDVQDKVLNAIHRLKSVTTNKILIILEHCSKSAA